MATVTAFIRTSTSKKAKEVNVRFRLRDGRSLQLFHTSELTINSDIWDEKRQAIKAKVLHDEKRRIEFNSAVNDRKNLISEIYSENIGQSNLSSEWLDLEIDKCLYPVKYNIVEKKASFFESFEKFLEKRKLSDIRKRNFRVIVRALKRFELYKNITSISPFELTLDTVTVDTLNEIETFLKNEYIFFEEYPAIYEAVPESRKPKPRGQNTLNDIFTKIRTFFIWAKEEEELTKNNPFKKFPIEECVYGTPYYISKEELNKIHKTNLSRHPEIAKNRDIFVFQCSIGCRVGDLYKMTKANFINGAIEYIARKTKDDNPITVRVPLNSMAKAIMQKYSDCTNTLFPFSTQNQYNKDIKRIFLAAGITRKVTVLNPLTRDPEIKPINEIASSHITRRTLIGNLYRKVKDPNLVGALSGHKEGSKAFARYRDIDDEIKTELVNMLE